MISPTIATSELLELLRLRHGVDLREQRLHRLLRDHPDLRPAVVAGRRRWTRRDLSRLIEHLAVRHPTE